MINAVKKRRRTTRVNNIAELEWREDARGFWLIAKAPTGEEMAVTLLSKSDPDRMRMAELQAIGVG